MNAENDSNKALQSDEELLQNSAKLVNELRQTRQRLEILEQQIAENLEALKKRLQRGE